MRSGTSTSFRRRYFFTGGSGSRGSGENSSSGGCFFVFRCFSCIRFSFRFLCDEFLLVCFLILLFGFQSRRFTFRCFCFFSFHLILHLLPPLCTFAFGFFLLC